MFCYVSGRNCDKRGNLEDVCTSIFAMLQLARKEGLLALEAELDRLDDEFMKKGLKLTVDGTEPELIKGILETELLHQMEDNDKIIQFWQDLGAYAPAWGMVGTLLGLINMLKAMGTDTGVVGEGMSLALLTTLYGSLLANWGCIPVARKLKKNSVT